MSNEEEIIMPLQSTTLPREVRAIDNRHIEYPPIHLMVHEARWVALRLPSMFLRAGKGDNARVNKVRMEWRTLSKDLHLIRLCNDVRKVDLPRDSNAECVMERWEQAETFIESANHYVLWVDGLMVESRNTPKRFLFLTEKEANETLHAQRRFDWVRDKPALERRSPTLGASLVIDVHTSNRYAALVPVVGMAVNQIWSGDSGEAQRLARSIVPTWGDLMLDCEANRRETSRRDVDSTFFHLMQGLKIDATLTGPIGSLWDDNVRISGNPSVDEPALLFIRIGESRKTTDGGTLENVLDWSNAIPILDLCSTARIRLVEEREEQPVRLSPGRYLVVSPGSPTCWAADRWSGETAGLNPPFHLWQESVGSGRDYTRHMRYVVRRRASQCHVTVLDRTRRIKRALASNLKKDKKEIRMQNKKFMRRI